MKAKKSKGPRPVFWCTPERAFAWVDLQAAVQKNLLFSAVHEGTGPVVGVTSDPYPYRIYV